MNYKYHYDALICSRKELPRIKGEGVYYERHHIVPRSMGGGDDSSNLILLTGREHYIAHLLLWKMYPESKSMHYAFMVMCNKSITKVSSRIYETLRKNHSEIVSKYQSGENHPMFGKTLSEEHRDKLRELRTGSKQSAETVEKRASKNRGKKWAKPMSQEQRQKLSEIKKGKEIHQNPINVVLKNAKDCQEQKDNLKLYLNITVIRLLVKRRKVRFHKKQKREWMLGNTRKFWKILKNGQWRIITMKFGLS